MSRPETRRRRMGALNIGWILGICAVTMLVPTAAASATTPAPVRVDGIYRVVSTDCYFAAGKCHARFDIEQSGTTLSDRTDKYFHGRIKGDRVRVGETFPPGTSEDGWVAVGTTSDGGRTISGNFFDGIGGSGIFTMSYIGP